MDEEIVGHVIRRTRICRVCIENAVKCTSLSATIEISSSLSFLGFLNKCTNLNASENDKLPQILCSYCAKSLKKFYSFVKLAEKSNVILRETWKSLLAPGRNGRISCGTITNERIEKESEDIKLVDSEDVEINESEKCNSNLDQPERNIEEVESARRLVRNDTETIDLEDDIPVTFLKRRLAQIEDEADWNHSNLKKKTGKTRCKEVINEEAPGPTNIPCSGGSFDDNETSCEEIATNNEKIAEESEVFRKENSFHWQTNENSSGSSLYILDIVKEEACVSEGISIVDTNDSEIKERETSKSNLDQPEGHIEEPEDILSYIDDYLTNIFAEHSDSRENEPITLMKRRFKKSENKIDVQNNHDQSHCISSNVKKKTDKTEADSERVFKGAPSNRPRTTTEYRNRMSIGHAGTNQILSEAKDDSLKPNVPGRIENTNKCKECDFDSNDREKLTTDYQVNIHGDKQGILHQHLVIHKETKQYKCSICGKGFIHLSCRWKHMKLHGKNPYECEICGEKLRNKADLKSHLRNHSNIRFTCPQCGRVYKSKKNLLSHIDSHASNQPESQINSKEITSKQYKINKKCYKCDTEFENWVALSKHMKSHIKTYSRQMRKDKCEICDTFHEHNGNKIKCQQCGKEFIYRSTLCMHMKRHAGPKSFKCEKCDETFCKKDELNVHMENHTRFICDQCGRECKDSDALERHKKLHPEPMKCEKCGIIFTRRRQFNVHMQNHKRVKKKCQQCGKELTNRYHLRRHMKLHVDSKPLRCNNCGKLLSSKGSFVKHMKICQPVGNSVEQPAE